MNISDKAIIILFDREQRIISANDNFFQASGYSYESLLRKPIAALFQNFQASLPFNFAYEPLVLIAADGGKHSLYGEICSLPHHPFSSQWVLIGFMVDESHIANHCLACRSIIHDINNVLAAAYAILSMMDIEVNSATAILNQKKELWATLRRLNDLFVELRHTSIGAAMMKTPCAIADVVRESLNLAVLARNNVSISFSCPDKIPPVKANKNAIFRVFYNIFVNACEAMENNGLLTVKISFEEKTSGELMPQSMVQVTISDSGPGINPAILPSIFLPSFSTKGESRGMGLYIAKNIIEKHGGTITATPDALFVIKLPAG